jgi:hypothetical protein
MNYRVHGLVVASPTALPLPEIGDESVDVAYRVGLESAALPAPSFSRGDDEDDPWVVEHWEGGRLVVEFTGSARFELSREEVVLLADESGDPDLVTHLLLDHVLPRVVALRGDLMLHGAGAVGPSGRAHLLLGPTGTGKSTLVTALGAGGWALLDDDGIRVLNVEGVPHAVPGYAGVRLLPDAAEAVLPGVVGGRPMARGHAKRRFAVDGLALGMAEGPAPIAGLYVLERTANERPSVDRMGFGEAVGAITEHGFHLADEPAAITREAFERASTLAAAVPVWRLRCAHGLEHLDRTLALLAELDATDRG